MLSNFIQNIPHILAVFLMCSGISVLFYQAIMKSRHSKLSFLYVPAGKSETNAKLLGGLGMSSSMICTIVYINLFSETVYVPTEISDLLAFSIVPFIILTAFGYLDDRFEIRVRYKLLMQFISIISFAYYSAKLIAPNHTFLGFCFSSFMGLGLINGTNLLDGLDTMTIKLGSVATGALMYLALKTDNHSALLICVATLASLSMFYIYNKEPAKLYMGEIGGSVLGFIFYLQLTLNYQNIRATMHGTNALALIMIAAYLPMAELGISFIRRIWAKKSPFRGDKLHLHYILKGKFDLSASNTSSIYAQIQISTIVLGFFAADVTNQMIGFVVALSSFSLTYLVICKDVWMQNKYFDRNKNLFKYFEGKNVHLLDSNLFDSASIYIARTSKDDKIKANKNRAA